MNRRTFLKLTTLTGITAISTPTLLANIDQKESLKWISFADKIPEIGQKVIITNSKGRLMLGGRINKTRKGAVAEVSQMNFYFTPINLIKDFIKRQDIGLSYSTYLIFSKEGEKIIKSRKWLSTNNNDIKRDYKNYRKQNSYGLVAYHKDYHYWMPVNGEYPINIPPFPEKNF